jgi:hypothetical protein
MGELVAGVHFDHRKKRFHVEKEDLSEGQEINLKKGAASSPSFVYIAQFFAYGDHTLWHPRHTQVFSKSP